LTGGKRESTDGDELSKSPHVSGQKLAHWLRSWPVKKVCNAPLPRDIARNRGRPGWRPPVSGQNLDRRKAPLPLPHPFEIVEQLTVPQRLLCHSLKAIKRSYVWRCHCAYTRTSWRFYGSDGASDGAQS
jgi:hypothetical protein